jgi:TolA-binding protein
LNKEERTVKRHIHIVLIPALLLLLLLPSCLPPTNSKSESTNTASTTSRRGESRATSTKRSDTRSKSTDKNADKPVKPKTAKQIQKEKADSVAAVEQKKQEDIAKEKATIARLVDKALVSERVQTRKENSSKATPFEQRKNKLKDIDNEEDRFIDTTYYVLTMEDGITTVSNDISKAGATRAQLLEMLITNYIETVKKFENNKPVEPETFRMFSQQLAFNDSLRQDADYYSAEANLQHNNIDEAIGTLETLCNSKPNRAIAPKALLRLGQVYCLTGNTKDAEKYFKRLKKEFPRSPLNKSADCGRM